MSCDSWPVLSHQLWNTFHFRGSKTPEVNLPRMTNLLYFFKSYPTNSAFYNIKKTPRYSKLISPNGASFSRNATTSLTRSGSLKPPLLARRPAVPVRRVRMRVLSERCVAYVNLSIIRFIFSIIVFRTIDENLWKLDHYGKHSQVTISRKSTISN